jgi:hypothetical protein
MAAPDPSQFAGSLIQPEAAPSRSDISRSWTEDALIGYDPARFEQVHQSEK